MEQMQGTECKLDYFEKRLFDEGVEPIPIHPSKRIMDIALSGIGIIASAPVMLAAATGIKIEGCFDSKARMPVIYKQERIGRGGRPFTMYKFCTMPEGSEEKLPELMGGRYGSNIMCHIKNDPRATRVGRILRRYKINELPQLFNVIKGDMSLVGPRPLLREHSKIVLDRGGYHRLRCLPGLTGPVQINDRYSNSDEGVDATEKGYSDFCEDGYSIWRDLGYMFNTVGYIMKQYSE